MSWAFDGERPGPIEGVLGVTTPPACRFAAATWSGPLRLSAALGAFVTVDPGRAATIAIPEGDARPGARVSVQVLGVQLNGLVAADDLEIYLKKTQFLDGYVWVGANAALHWTRASAGRLAYRVDLPRRVSPAVALPSGERACQALSVESEGDDAALWRALLAGRRSVLRARWNGDERVPVSRAPGQPAVAFLDTRALCPSDEPECAEPEEAEEVLVLERRAASVRIANLLETVVVVGWVPLATLQEPFEPFDTDQLLLGPGAPWGLPMELFGASDPMAKHDGSQAVCAWNAPLVAETSGVMRTVGSLASGIPLLPGARRQGWREVSFEHRALAFAAGARSWVPEHLLYPCRR